MSASKRNEVSTMIFTMFSFWLATSILAVTMTYNKTGSAGKAWIVLILCFVIAPVAWVIGFLFCVTASPKQEIADDEEVAKPKSFETKINPHCWK